MYCVLFNSKRTMCTVSMILIHKLDSSIQYVYNGKLYVLYLTKFNLI